MKRFLLSVLAAIVLAPAPAVADVLSATPATLNSVFAGAEAGDRINLSAGDYGQRTFYRTFPNTNRVTINGSRSAQMDLLFDNQSQGLRFQNFTLGDSYFNDSRVKNITIHNVDSTGQMVFRIDAGIQDANILVQQSDFHDWDYPGCCTFEGRISICGCGNSNFNNGITIARNRFFGGASDGIQDSATGTRIISNEFFGIQSDDATGVHADPVQIWGGCCHVVDGNYIHDNPGVSTFMDPDGNDHETFTDNVVAGDASMYPYTPTLHSDDGTRIVHNTFASYANGQCAFGLTCGIIRLGYKAGQDDPGHDTIIRNNIAANVNEEGSTYAACDHNLFVFADCGAANIVGRPTYVGGTAPQTYEGFKLAAGSLGKGAASDGLDIGARIP